LRMGCECGNYNYFVLNN